MTTENETRERTCLECGNELTVIDHWVNSVVYRCAVCGVKYMLLDREFRELQGVNVK